LNRRARRRPGRAQLGPPVYPSQSNDSWVALCLDVQLTQLMGMPALLGYPVTRTRYWYPVS
jgi:hypothetical protein